MAERDETEKPVGEQPPAASPPGLPNVEGPSISPARAADEGSADPALLPHLPDPASQPKQALTAGFAWSRIAGPASVAAAALFGAVIGALAMGHLAAPQPDSAALAERHAAQQSLAKLGKEVSTLKAELTAAHRTARAQTAQLAKLSETLTEKLTRDSALVTGSIQPPQTIAAAPAAAAASPQPAAQAMPPLPQPRPAQIARVEAPRAVPGWSVLGERRGFVYVRSAHEIFRVAPGARLPGLGLVEEVRRQDGGWVVVTPRGLIVAEHEPRFYEPF